MEPQTYADGKILSSRSIIAAANTNAQIRITQTIPLFHIYIQCVQKKPNRYN